jgi:beta-1,4-mannosyl-glycoprotein beta-1,4-N-acetylglucosaminyltransferase
MLLYYLQNLKVKFLIISMNMKIYDCFTFFNEFELLELRLRELYDHVDCFVLVEADRTFQNKEKPFYFTEQMNAPRWQQYRDKIKVVRVADMPIDTDTWGRERHQRDAIIHG